MFNNYITDFIKVGRLSHSPNDPVFVFIILLFLFPHFHPCVLSLTSVFLEQWNQLSFKLMLLYLNDEYREKDSLILKKTFNI